MKITPVDIAHKTFNKKMIGLDENEVLQFLELVASQMQELIQEKNSLKEALRDRDLSLNDLKEKDHVLKATITTASHMAERLREDAEREAKLTITDAQQKAEVIVRDSRDSLRKMYNEMSELKRLRLQFEANLKALAQAHLSLLEQGEKYMPSVQLPNSNIQEGKNPRSSEISPLTSGL